MYIKNSENIGISNYGPCVTPRLYKQSQGKICVVRPLQLLSFNIRYRYYLTLENAKKILGSSEIISFFHNSLIISGVYFCDITIPEAFVVPVEPFDVVIASLVFDVVAITDKMYISSLTNVLQYLKVKSSNQDIIK